MREQLGVRERGRDGGRGGRKGISRKLKNTHCVRSMWMMSPPFHLVYLIPPLLAQQNATTWYRPLETNREEKVVFAHTHTHT